jgi:hypothetical protein
MKATLLTGKRDMTAGSMSLVLLVPLLTLGGRRLGGIIPLHTVATGFRDRDINVFHNDYAARRNQGHRFEEDGVGQTFGRKRHTVDFEIEGTSTSVNQTGLSRAGSTCA